LNSQVADETELVEALIQPENGADRKEFYVDVKANRGQSLPRVGEGGIFVLNERLFAAQRRAD
jgi:hypothetical protein